MITAFGGRCVTSVTTEKVIKHKVGLLNLARELGNVSKACKMMELSRDTFYRYQAALDTGGVEALFESVADDVSPILKTGWMMPLRRRWSNMLWHFRPMDSTVPATSCACAGSLSPAAGYAASGYATTWPILNIDSAPWKPRSPATALSSPTHRSRRWRKNNAMTRPAVL
jgi:hypothetical protein